MGCRNIMSTFGFMRPPPRLEPDLRISCEVDPLLDERLSLPKDEGEC